MNNSLLRGRLQVRILPGSPLPLISLKKTAIHPRCVKRYVAHPKAGLVNVLQFMILERAMPFLFTVSMIQAMHVIWDG